MKIFESPKQTYNHLSDIKKTQTIGFVPTMGALHQGHASLVKKAQTDNDIVVVSIFLNPTQFDNSQDLQTYPQSLNRDCETLQKLGVDFLFLPNFESIYPDQYRYKVTENFFSKKLCGKSRLGHFDGVLTVVLKLLNIVSPDKAYFGEKDFQQYQLIQEMVDTFFMNVAIIACPTVREDSGLAMSSRNQKLSPLGIEKANFFARQLAHEKNMTQLTQKLKKEDIKIDYLEDIQQRRFAAVQIEDVRLIDNVPL